MVFQTGNRQVSKGYQKRSLTSTQSRPGRQNAAKGLKSNPTQLAGHCEQDQIAVKAKLREKLRENLRSIFKFEPHKEQLDAISHLIHDKEDLILIARTGWGKSVIFQSAPLLIPRGICLMLCPLTALEEDQAKQINALDGFKACVLNADTQNRKLLEDIKNGCYTHILTSPEIALGEEFRNLLGYKAFYSRIALVAIYNPIFYFVIFVNR